MAKFKGINHLAMATGDMDRTTRFWRDLLGMRLVAGLGKAMSDGVLEKSLPVSYALYQNHPNPFNPSTTISFSLPKAGETTVEVFNVSGQKVATLASGFRQAGRHSIIWNAKSFSAGMYFCTIRQGNEAKKLKMTLMK